MAVAAPAEPVATNELVQKHKITPVHRGDLMIATYFIAVAIIIMKLGMTKCFLLSDAHILQKATAVMKSPQTVSRRMQNQRVSEQERNQAEVWRSWCRWYSWMKMGSTPKARMVCRPCRVAFTWLIMGLRAERCVNMHIRGIRKSLFLGLYLNLICFVLAPRLVYNYIQYHCHHCRSSED